MKSSENGHGGFARLEKALAKHEHIVESLRLALEVMRGEAHASSAKRAPQVLAQAVQIDAGRRRGRPRNPHRGHKVKDQRQRSADFLSQFDATTPSTHSVAGFASLIRRGYLKKKGEGYVRTSKPYEV